MHNKLFLHKYKTYNLLILIVIFAAHIEQIKAMDHGYLDLSSDSDKSEIYEYGSYIWERKSADSDSSAESASHVGSNLNPVYEQLKQANEELAVQLSRANFVSLQWETEKKIAAMLTKEREQLTTQHDNAVADLAQKHAQYQSSLITIDVLRDDVGELEDEKESLKTENSTLQNQVQESQANAKRLEKIVRRQSKKYQKLLNKFTALKKKHASSNS